MECPICIEPYNSSDRKPMSLECGHSLCGPCLESLFKTKRECPIDRIRILKPLEAIPINFGVLQIIEATKSLSDLKLAPPEPPVPIPVNISPYNEGLHPTSSIIPKHSASEEREARINRFMNYKARTDYNREALETRMYSQVPHAEVHYPKHIRDIEFKKRNVVVKNLPLDFTEAVLRYLFKDYGEIESVKLVTEVTIERDANGKIEKNKVTNGTGFVLFQNQSDAEKAIQELNGIVIDDKTLFLQMWKPRSEWTKRPKQSKEVTSESPSINSYNPHISSFNPYFPPNESYHYQQPQYIPISNPYSSIPPQAYNPYINPPMNMQNSIPFYQAQSNSQAPYKRYQKKSFYPQSVYNPYHHKRY
jgi:RNA recognition motif-containing protein